MEVRKLNKKAINAVVLIFAVVFAASLILPVSAREISEESKPAIGEVHVDMSTLFQQLGSSSANVDERSLVQLLRTYRTQAVRGTDGNYYVRPTITSKVDVPNMTLNIGEFSSQQISPDGSTIQAYSMTGEGAGKACIMIAIWDYPGNNNDPGLNLELCYDSYLIMWKTVGIMIIGTV